MTIIAIRPAPAPHGGNAREQCQPSFLERKLHIPQPSFPVVHRRRVTELLDEASRRRVTLVCAGAGWGKTVALASWAAGRGSAEPIVWVTADADDRLEWFWAHVYVALRRARVALPEVIQSLEDVSAADFPMRLVGAVHLFSEPLMLVLDSVHEVTDDAVLNGLAFLIHHAPPALRFMLSGRRMPEGLQLARLRVSELAGIGAKELASTAEEAGAFLARLGIEAGPAERDQLLRRTKGQIAGLRLAALRANGRARARRHDCGTEPIAATSLWDMGGQRRSGLPLAQ